MRVIIKSETPDVRQCRALFFRLNSKLSRQFKPRRYHLVSRRIVSITVQYQLNSTAGIGEVINMLL